MTFVHFSLSEFTAERVDVFEFVKLTYKNERPNNADWRIKNEIESKTNRNSIDFKK